MKWYPLPANSASKKLSTATLWIAKSLQDEMAPPNPMKRYPLVR